LRAPTSWTFQDAIRVKPAVASAGSSFSPDLHDDDEKMFLRANFDGTDIIDIVWPAATASSWPSACTSFCGRTNRKPVPASPRCTTSQYDMRAVLRAFLSPFSLAAPLRQEPKSPAERVGHRATR
jgi:hypothetical protein